MRTTNEIKDKLTSVEKEIKRISEILINVENYEKPYTYVNGDQHPEWTFDDALTSFVSQKLCLKWVLKSSL